MKANATDAPHPAPAAALAPALSYVRSSVINGCRSVLRRRNRALDSPDGSAVVCGAIADINTKITASGLTRGA